MVLTIEFTFPHTSGKHSTPELPPQLHTIIAFNKVLNPGNASSKSVFIFQCCFGYSGPSFVFLYASSVSAFPFLETGPWRFDAVCISHTYRMGFFGRDYHFCNVGCFIGFNVKIFFDLIG